jgi:hypothetical protein
MTRNPHYHREWTNKELEQDPQGYLAAQAAYNENREAERRRGLEEADRQDFEHQFVAAGGTKSESDKEWQRHKNEMAAQAARRADTEAAEQSRRQIRSRL